MEFKVTISEILTIESLETINQLILNPKPVTILVDDTGLTYEYLSDRLEQETHIVQELVSKTSVGIDQVRELKKLISHKNSSGRTYIMVPKGQSLSIPAQNALLKNLEELGESYHVIIIVEQLAQLLPTVLSRSAVITPVYRPLKVSDFTDSIVDEMTAKQIDFLASGKPAVIKSLLEDESLLEEATQEMKHAKRFVSGSKSDRLAVMKQLADKTAAQRFMQSVLKIQKTMLRLATENQNEVQAIQSANLALISDLTHALKANINPKIVLLKLAIEYR